MAQSSGALEYAIIDMTDQLVLQGKYESVAGYN